MPALAFRLFGRMSVLSSEQSAEIKLQPSLRTLLAYLLLNRSRNHRREVITDLFWQELDEERARQCLSSSLWRLRNSLAEHTAESLVITAAGGEIGIDTGGDYWLDVAAFDEQVAAGLEIPVTQMSTEGARRLEDANTLYVGDLLEGHYDDWVLIERERLRSLYIASLAHLAAYYEYHQRYERAVRCGQEILNLDPLREEIHRDLMRVYAANGQRPLALQQYDKCCEVLDAELGISPMKETQDLFRRLVHADVSSAEARLPPPRPHANAEAWRELRDALKFFEETEAQMRSTIQRLRLLLDSK